MAYQSWHVPALTLLSLCLWEPEAEVEGTGWRVGSLCGFRTRAVGCSCGSQTSLTTVTMDSFQPSQSQGQNQCAYGILLICLISKGEGTQEGLKYVEGSL